MPRAMSARTTEFTRSCVRLQVVLVVAALVGVARDFEERELGVVRERRRHRVEDLVRRREDLAPSCTRT